MSTTTSSDDVQPLGGPTGQAGSAGRDPRWTERGPQGCGWPFRGHAGHRFGRHADDRSGGCLGERFGDRFGDHFAARMAERFGRGGRGGWHRVPVDIEDTPDAFVLSLYAAGLDRQQIAIGVHEDVLTIRHQSSQGAGDGERRFTRRESRSPDFVREFALNGKVRTEAIEASYADGVLTVRLPKTPQAMQPEQRIIVR